MDRLFIAKDKERLYQCYSVDQIGNSLVISNEAFLAEPEKFREIRYIFSTWGMINLTEEEIASYFPKLEAVYYAAGSVKPFALPFMARGVRIFSAWVANAVVVSELLMAQIILANKGYFMQHRRYKEEGFPVSRAYCRSFPGNFNAKVGFIGCGSVTKHTIERLKPFRLEIFVVSKHLKEEEAKEMGVTKVDLPFLFGNCDTISNNLPNLKGTEGIIDYKLLSTMKEHATFINTGRGAQVNFEDLKQVMREKIHCCALLDVTDPHEPLDLADDVWEIPNIFITPHAAGANSQEIFRLGEYMVEEHEKMVKGNAVLYEVLEEMLETMA